MSKIDKQEEQVDWKLQLHRLLSIEPVNQQEVLDLVEDYSFRKYQKGYQQGKFDQKMEQEAELQEAHKQAINDCIECVENAPKHIFEKDGKVVGEQGIYLGLDELLSKLKELE